MLAASESRGFMSSSRLQEWVGFSLGDLLVLVVTVNMITIILDPI